MSDAPAIMIIEEWEPHPAPLHTSRQPWPEAIKVPRSVATLVKLGEAHGWDTVATYSLGYVATTGKGKVKLVHTILVRMTRVLEGGVIRRGAVYYEAKPATPLKWEAKEATVLGVDHWPFREGLSVTSLQGWVRESALWTGPQVEAWARPLKDAALTKKADAAVKARATPHRARVTS
jgi:hypothetical protein